MAKTKSTKSIAARTQTDGWRGHQVEQCFWHAAVISGAAPDTCPALLSGEVRKTEKEVYTISESDNICWRNYHRYETHEGSYTCDVRGEHANTISCGTTPMPADPWSTREPQRFHHDKEIKSAICLDLNKRHLNDEQKEILYVASAMDTRFKALPFLSEDKCQDIYASRKEPGKLCQ